MHIISGTLKGRNIDGYDIVGTRPTMNRVKESLIAMIQNKIDNSTCLDLFAGSGSIGLELISNGCQKCFFVDHSQKVIEILKKNIKQLNIQEKVEIIKYDYQQALKYFKEKEIQFDIIFLDPPYDLNLISNSIELILKYNLLKKDGIIICEYEKEQIKTELILFKERKYGDKYIQIYKKQ